MLNPNIKSFSDEIKLRIQVNMPTKQAALKEIVVIAAYGVVPKDDPKPDLLVWKALNTQRYYPDKNLVDEDFHIEGNFELLREAMGATKSIHHSHFMSNTRRVGHSHTLFKFPKPKDKKMPYDLWTKIKIKRKNGLGTFYSENEVYKTVYCVKVVPVIKGGAENEGDGTQGKVGSHLTIPISVKAKKEPSEADKRVLAMMYEGGDFERYVPKQKLGEMKTSMVQPSVAIGVKGQKYNRVGVAGGEGSGKEKIEVRGVGGVDLGD